MTTLRARPDRAAGHDLAMARRHVTDACIAASAEANRDGVLAFVDANHDALHRSCPAGHLTGSALVVDATLSRFVVLHHRKLGIWVQPGGHADGVDDLALVALAEASEETGIAGLAVYEPAVDIDIHQVHPPGESPHLHLDIRYVVVAPPHAEPTGNHESTDIRWITEAELDDIGADPGLRRFVAHGLAAARATVHA